MKFIELKEGYKVYYQEYLSEYDDKILKIIYKNLDIYKLNSNKDMYVTGLQTPIIIKCKELDDILSKGDELSLNLSDGNNKEILGRINLNWIYIKKPNDAYMYNENDGFHRHSKSMYSTQNQLTWTYYYQMPNNCTGNEGDLRIKIDDEIYYIPVKEKTFYFFDANWYHSPDKSPNSDKDRVVIVGTISFVYDDLIKINNTII